VKARWSNERQRRTHPCSSCRSPPHHSCSKVASLISLALRSGFGFPLPTVAMVSS